MGFGTGIMVGAMLLQFILFADEPGALPELPEEEKRYSQAELDEAVENAVAEAIAALPAAAGGQTDPSPGGSADPDDGLPSSSESAADAASAPNPDPADNRIVAFYIYRGMNLTEVARSLQALGLIEQADDFIEAARPISRKIEIGTASFTGQPTYDEIIAELTRPKNG